MTGFFRSRWEGRVWEMLTMNVEEWKNHGIIDNRMFVCSWRSYFRHVECKVFSELSKHYTCQDLNSRDRWYSLEIIKALKLIWMEMIILSPKYWETYCFKAVVEWASLSLGVLGIILNDICPVTWNVDLDTI